MTKVKFEEEVDCAFGKNHKVFISLENGELDNITCSCYDMRKETEGMIALGTPEEKTCLGIMNLFIETCKQGHSYYRYRRDPLGEYVLSNLINTVISSAAIKKKQREELKNKASVIFENEGAVERGLRNYMTEQIGSVNVKYAIIRCPNTKIYTFNILKDKRTYWDSTKMQHILTEAGKVELAFRVDGHWELVDDWKDKMIASFKDRNCPWCDVTGTYDHTNTATHAMKIERTTIIALQATSSAGIKKVKKMSKDGKLHKLRYKVGSNKALGVVFPYEPEVVNNTMENENAE